MIEDLELAELHIRRAIRRRDELVLEARHEGCEWSTIARALGRPIQNIRRKYEPRLEA